MILRTKSLNLVLIRFTDLKNLIKIAFLVGLLLFISSCEKHEPLILKNGLAPESTLKAAHSSADNNSDNNGDVNARITDPENEEDKEVGGITDPENEIDKDVH